MTEKIECPHCGKKIKASARHCGFCGGKIETPVVETGKKEEVAFDPSAIPSGRRTPRRSDAIDVEKSEKPEISADASEAEINSGHAMPGGKICASCGAKLSARAKVCGKCGSCDLKAAGAEDTHDTLTFEKNVEITTEKLSTHSIKTTTPDKPFHPDFKPAGNLK